MLEQRLFGIAFARDEHLPAPIATYELIDVHVDTPLPGYDWVAGFLAEHHVELVASLPCYSKDNVDAQRGNGVFETSIRALQRLNRLGYGAEGSGLVLNLLQERGLQGSLQLGQCFFFGLAHHPGQEAQINDMAYDRCDLEMLRCVSPERVQQTE